jgi:hypothetical protein
MKYLYLSLILLILILSGCSKNDNALMCTQEAKICSDGTAVGRNGSNNCEFNACPADKIYIGESPEKCMVIKFACTENRQAFFDDKGCGCEVIKTTEKLKAIDCTERTQACTREYMPVCGQVQVQCIRAPCLPIMQTFSNKCEACANNFTISYTEGACAEDVKK